MLAAHRAGMKRVLLPKRNQRDVDADIPKEIRHSMKFRFVSSLEDVLAEAFDGKSGSGSTKEIQAKESDIKALRSKL